MNIHRPTRYIQKKRHMNIPRPTRHIQKEETHEHTQTNKTYSEGRDT